MRRFGRSLFLGIVFLAAAPLALAQIDPESRRLVEFGFNQSFQGAAPLAGYGFYYFNEPHFPMTNTTLRLAVAPVYLDSELGLLGALGAHTDLGIGLAGGGFADSYYQFYQGKYRPDASFMGYGAEVSSSLYHQFMPDARIPLAGIVRLRLHDSLYDTYDTTSHAFVLPRSGPTLALRTGLRWGGREPLLSPDLAMEVSAWCESQYRANAGSYGFDGDRAIEEYAELFWSRALLIYTLPESKKSFGLTFNSGASLHPDRFGAYRFGGTLPLSAEFPLMIPGYFYQELSARSFVSMDGQYSVPLDPGKHWRLTAFGAVADLQYTPGLAQPGGFNSGIGAGAGYRSSSGKWQILGAYGYGFEAIRSSGRGGQTVGILGQIDFKPHKAPAP